MVDVIAPAPESNPIVEVLLIICTLAFAITALVYTVFERYLVLIVAMILCGIFSFMYLITKGWKR